MRSANQISVWQGLAQLVELCQVERAQRRVVKEKMALAKSELDRLQAIRKRIRHFLLTKTNRRHPVVPWSESFIVRTFAALSVLCASAFIPFSLAAQLPPLPRLAAAANSGTFPVSLTWDWGTGVLPSAIRFTWHTNGGTTNTLTQPATPARVDLQLAPGRWNIAAYGVEGTELSGPARLTVTRTNYIAVDLTHGGITDRVYTGPARGSNGTFKASNFSHWIGSQQ